MGNYTAKLAGARKIWERFLTRKRLGIARFSTSAVLFFIMPAEQMRRVRFGAHVQALTNLRPYQIKAANEVFRGARNAGESLLLFGLMGVLSE